MAIWYGALAALAGGWLFALVPAARAPPERGWLAMFALTSIVMLASTPICWNHYFLWTMPAALFLLHRPKLLIMLALLSLGITMWPAARSLGCHMMMGSVSSSWSFTTCGVNRWAGLIQRVLESCLPSHGSCPQHSSPLLLVWSPLGC